MGCTYQSTDEKSVESILDQREYIYFIKMNLKFKDFQVSNNYFKSHQENKIEFLDEICIQAETTLKFECQIRFS